MAHNVDLPRHRYCYVIEEAVLHGGSETTTLPCVWWGMSATPGRMFGCHILLESGAMVVDLPLHALRHQPTATQPWTPQEAQRWDGYGWSMETYEPAYLADLRCRVLAADHKNVVGRGDLWFAVDHVRDGYSLEPGQHKIHWVVALADGVFTCVPQDMVLVTETSFTIEQSIPRIRRQDDLWSCE